ncbi:GIN domain-containing protein [Pedobacter aquatilis]|uniref:GIN domain-containing protein n=1 Tax=Pedobacter aquatilis TaxID=351343 RepID=UPI002930054F|nr:DUF2807 domain-containing protein [Pedobacter aquatilis]
MKTILKKNIIPTLGIFLCLILTEPNALNAQKIPVDKPVKLSSFNRIVVNGNVEVLLVQRPNVGINYQEDSEYKATVTQQGEKLCIKGPNNGLVAKVIVYINNIYRIEAFDSSLIKADSRLNFKLFQIVSKDNAKVDIDVSTEGLYTDISDKSTLIIRGETDQHTLITKGTPKLLFNNFVVRKLDSRIKPEDALVRNK